MATDTQKEIHSDESDKTSAMGLFKEALKKGQRDGLAAVAKSGKRELLRQTFALWERLGMHVIPVHYYQPIPNTDELTDDLWETGSELVGIDINENEQIDLLSEFRSQYGDEYNAFASRDRKTRDYNHYRDERSFGSVDTEILYSMVRHFEPNRLIEIGSGASTRISAEGLRKNERSCEFITIDPNPDETLQRDIPELSEVIPEKVQNVPLSVFEQLGENDILFIDSTHVLHTGSDVQYEYLEILPRLNDSVLVHSHDIFSPVEYPREWLMKRRWFLNEQYLHQAFLTFNESYEVMWAGSYMHIHHPDRLEKAIDSYRTYDGHPGSFWIRKTG